MDEIIQLLIDYGDVGMGIAAFLSGSILPFSSEVVMLGLLAVGSSPYALLLWGTLGNTLGSLLNFGVGALGKEEWITRFAKLSPEKLERGKRWVQRYGAWAGLLAWLPVLGEIITVAMGFLRVNFAYSLLTITLGKLIRYWVLLQAYFVASS
ncbi:MAG: YqaA family protein [Prevotellamassilia sp.]